MEMNSLAAFSGQEAGFAQVGRLRSLAGVLDFLYRIAELPCTLQYSLFEGFVDLLQLAFDFLEVGDIRKGRDVTASRQGVALYFDHGSVRPGPLVAVNRPAAQVLQALANFAFQFAVAEQAALGIETDQLFNRLTQVHDTIGEVQQLQVSTVPADQPQVPVDHGDPLRHIVQGRFQQFPVELDGL